MQPRRFCLAIRLSFPWPPSSLLGPRRAIAEIASRGAAPQQRPIGRMLLRAVFAPVSSTGTGVINDTTEATWRTWGCYLSKRPNREVACGCLVCAPPRCGSKAAAVQPMCPQTSPSPTRHRTSVHHFRYPLAAFLPGDWALARHSASTPWLCC